MANQAHWQNVYSRKSPVEVSWYRPHLERSLEFIRSCHLESDARIVDIGGGASTLVDDLIADGFRNLAVIDLAEAALSAARQRLGEGAAWVDWVVGDATTSLLAEQSVDFWHDRAVFHFLTEADARAAYVAQVMRVVKPGGYVLIATFNLDGPERCSGLPVQRYDPAGIHAVLGDLFDKVGEASELHTTPSGGKQSFAYCLCRRRA